MILNATSLDARPSHHSSPADPAPVADPRLVMPRNPHGTAYVLDLARKVDSMPVPHDNGRRPTERGRPCLACGDPVPAESVYSRWCKESCHAAWCAANPIKRGGTCDWCGGIVPDGSRYKSACGETCGRRARGLDSGGRKT